MNTLYYRSFGNNGSAEQPLASKPCLILLHGLFGMSDNLSGLAKSLEDDFFVLVPDLVNHGRSPHRDRMDYPAMAADVLCLLRESGIDKACVLGHSMGGKVAMQMATMRPDLVSMLIVVDIAPVDYLPRHETILDGLHKIADLKVGSRREAEAILSAYVPEKALQQFLLKNMQKSSEGIWQWRFGLDEISNAYPDLIAAPVMQNVYTGRTLFIKGELSDYINAEHQELIRRWFPQAVLKIVQGAGHWVHADKPQVFNALVKRFLEEKS